MITIYEIAFSLLKGMGIELANKILDVVPNEEFFFNSKEEDLVKLIGRKHKMFDNNHRNLVLEKAKKEYEFIENNKIEVLYFRDKIKFPVRLYEANDAPILLYTKGHTDLNATHVISIVGTRNATQYGKGITEDLVKNISINFPNTIIVSGLAYGIDIAAHRASLSNNLPTAAVLAHGLNMIYPASHRNSAISIINQGGILISEYTSQDVIHKGNFLARNRIVAALSDCTIVIESAEKGGALVTAAIAGSYNKDVFAVSGRANDKYSVGCNKLIMSNKAGLITNADDLFNAMRWDKPTMQAKEKSLFPEYSKEEQDIINILEKEETHINGIAYKLSKPIHKVMSILVDMEFKGYIKALPGGKYTI